MTTEPEVLIIESLIFDDERHDRLEGQIPGSPVALSMASFAGA